MSKGGILGNPVKAITGTAKDIIKNPLPAIGTIAGEYLGGPVGAGIGDAAGDILSGQKIGTALTNGLETGGLAYGAGALANGAASDFPDTTSAASDFISSNTPDLGIGSTLDAAGNSISSGYNDVLNSLGISTTPAASDTVSSIPKSDSLTTSFSDPSSGGGFNPYTATGGVDPSGGGNALSGGADGTGFDNAISKLNGGTSLTNSTDKLTGSTGFSGLLDKIGLGKVTPIQGLSLAGLGATALAGQKKTAADQNLSHIGDTQQALGTELANTVNTGVLPAGMEQALDNEAENYKTAVRSKYAELGLSGSSSELAALQQVDQQVASYKAQQIESLTQQGLQALGAAGSTNQQIASNQINSDAELQKALAGLATIGGGSSGNSGAKGTITFG